jgi:hypothetical protein
LDDHFAADSVSDRHIETPKDYPFRPQPPVMGVRHDVNDQVDVSLWPKLAKFNWNHIAAVCFGIFFAFANLVVCPLFEMLGDSAEWHLLPGFILSAAILAEGVLLSAGLVFLPGPFWLRAVLCWGIGSILWTCWAIGLWLGWRLSPYGWANEMLQVGSFSLPLAALAIQSPLWFARCYSRWCLTNSNLAATMARPLSIRDYLIGTAVVALSITFARLARPASWPVQDYWPGWAIVFACFAGSGLLSVLPVMFLIFRFQNAWVGMGMLLPYGVIVGAILVGIDCAFDLTTFPFRIFLGTISISLPLYVAIGALLARACGYTLQFGRATR